MIRRGCGSRVYDGHFQQGTTVKAIQHRNLRACALLLALAPSAAFAAELFYESFTVPPDTTCPPSGAGGAGTYPFPTGWLLFNVDGRTPNPSVAYVNDAWEDREDFANDVTQCAAFSTSWYTPAGQADDWMWSPPVTLTAGATLTWRAIAYDPAYPDGYEVRIKTGTAPTLADQASSDVLLAVPAEQGVWTAHAQDISAYGGQTVYIGFRNHSNDKFLLLIDDVRVIDATPDVAAVASTAFASEYARAPSGMDVVPALGVNAFNAGGAVLTNVTATATLKQDGVAAGLPMPADAPIASLAIGASAPLAFGSPAAFSGDGAWTVEYAVSADQTNESDPLNNVVSVPGVTIGGNELARWEGDPTGTLGIGAGNGGELGVQLTIPEDGLYAGVRFGMAAIPPDDGGTPPVQNYCPGYDYVINLRALDTGTGMPGALIDTTVPVPCEFSDSTDSVTYDTAFAGGAHLLAAGTYVLTAVEPTGGPSGVGMTLGLMLHAQRFVAGTTWVNWPTAPSGQWAHFEAFGPNFAKTPRLSLLMAVEAPIFADGFDGVPPVKAPMRTSRRAAPEVVRGRPTRTDAPTRFVPAAAH